MPRARPQLKQRAQCPACGRLKIWYGETYNSHRRGNPNRRLVDNSDTTLRFIAATPVAECEGVGLPILPEHLRGEQP